uniref:Uncharacterized protein n=1 Tax=Oryza brachyantha TaxID=4533 RepID=J3LYL3_ORYBR
VLTPSINVDLILSGQQYQKVVACIHGHGRFDWAVCFTKLSTLSPLPPRLLSCAIDGMHSSFEGPCSLRRSITIKSDIKSIK